MICARSARTVRVVGRCARSHLTVGVTGIIRHWGAIATILHVVDQVLLICESVDAILVLDVTGREVEGHRVNAIAIVVSEGIVAIVASPSQQRTCHKHVREAGRAIHAGTSVIKAVHVHVERGRIHTLPVVSENVVFVVVAGSRIGTTRAGRSVTVAHTATVNGTHAVVDVIANAVGIRIHT